ncbi:MAG: hypothetical protein Q7T73_09830 [Beijerinckiaceae bacterium]|nr:hypothetical protein [Beijerinckiaceae bacterium]
MLPGDLRSERLVVRIHPDLMGILVQRSRELGLNRSTFVEKILIGWAVQSEGADLDGIGKHVPPRMSHDQPAPGSGPMKTMAQAFGFNSGRQPLAYKAALQKDDEEE